VCSSDLADLNRLYVQAGLGEQTCILRYPNRQVCGRGRRSIIDTAQILCMRLTGYEKKRDARDTRNRVPIVVRHAQNYLVKYLASALSWS